MGFVGFCKKRLNFLASVFNLFGKISDHFKYQGWTSPLLTKYLL